MLQKEAAVAYSTDSTTDLEEQDDEWSGHTWSREQLTAYATSKGRYVLLLRGYAVDVTHYMTEHVRLHDSHIPCLFGGTLTCLLAWRCRATATVFYWTEMWQE